MRAALISQRSLSSKWALEEMRKLFDVVDDINIKEIEINLGEKENAILYNGAPMPKYDCVYAKGSFRFNQLLRALTINISKDSYMPIDANAFTIGHHKLLTQLQLEQHNIPMPRTYLASSIVAARKLLEKLNYPIVFKFPEGARGKGVMFADSFTSATTLLDALDALRQPFIIQEYIEAGGIDVRAFVINDDVVASMKRKAVEGEMRSNLHSGGTGSAVELSNLHKKIAVDAAKAIGAEICGVDMINSAKGPLVLEVNLSPGLQGITKVTGMNVAGMIAQYLYKKTTELNNKKTKVILKDTGVLAKSDIITTLDFRGDRIILPAEISKMLNISERDEVIISVENKKLIIEKMN